MPFQLLTLGEVKERYPNTLVLCRTTGHERDYDRYPYGEYADHKDLYFPVRTVDDRHHPKKMMYIFRVNDRSVAFDPEQVSDGTVQKEIDGRKVSVRSNANEFFAEVDGKLTPGYWEMWFSWAIHHREDGYVWDEKL